MYVDTGSTITVSGTSVGAAVGGQRFPPQWEPTWGFPCMWVALHLRWKRAVLPMGPMTRCRSTMERPRWLWPRPRAGESRGQVAREAARRRHELLPRGAGAAASWVRGGSEAQWSRKVASGLPSAFGGQEARCFHLDDARARALARSAVRSFTVLSWAAPRASSSATR